MAAMVLFLVFVIKALLAVAHSNSTSCTTLQPVFAEPIPFTSTVFKTTSTSTSAVDCSGCALIVSTFRAVLATTGPSVSATVTSPSTTSTSYECLASTATTGTTATTSLALTPPSSTASPIPPVKPKVQALIDDLATALLYVELISNSGNLPKLCSTINPSGLDAITGIGINGSIVQSEVCGSAALQVEAPSFVPFLLAENGRDVTLLFTALFAVQVAGGYAGGTDLETLCSEIDGGALDAVFVNGAEGTGTAVQKFVCDAASST